MNIFYLSVFISICWAKLPNKITDGINANINIKNYNWHVSIYYKDTIICGGAVISMSHILTSANCIFLDPMDVKSNLKIITDIDDTNSKTKKFHNISLIIYHENYNAKNYWINDIAILKSEKLIPFTETCSHINLPNSFLRAMTLSQSTRWNKKNPLRNNSQKKLEIVNLKSLSHSECFDYFEGFTIFHVYQSCLVAIGANVLFSDGDSGNPVFHKKQIVGIVSIINPNKPRGLLITRVWAYTEWILNILEKY